MSCHGLFITGTDTGVGKTHVACLILRALKASGLCIAAYKPVCSGALDSPQNPPTWDDLLRLQAAVGGSTTIDQLCRQRFLAPLAPPLAARLEQRRVDPLAIDDGLADCCTRADAVVVEGAGGWLCPLTDTETLADWVARWRLPVLIVARRTLGTISHTLLTIESVRRRGLRVAGVVLNQTRLDDADLSVSTNCAEIEARSGVPVFGEVLYGHSSELRRDGRPVTISWRRVMGRLADPICLG